MQAFLPRHRVPTREFLMPVVEPSAFVLSTEMAPDAVVEIPTNGEADVVVKAVRLGDAKAAIKLIADNPPKGFSIRAGTLGPGKDEATVTLRAGRLPAGFAQNCVIAGEMKLGGQTVTRYAAAIPFRIVKAPALWATDLAPDADGVEALSGWAVDASWSRPGALTTVRAEKGKRLLEVTCEGESDKKLALVLLQEMDLSKAKRMDLVVTNPNSAPIAVSLAFSTADWKMHETPPVTVAAAKDPVNVSFRLDGSDFKSQATEWQHSAKLPGGGRVAKMLVIVQGLPEKAALRLDGMRFYAEAAAK
jgi:hypothetical protein